MAYVMVLAIAALLLLTITTFVRWRQSQAATEPHTKLRCRVQPPAGSLSSECESRYNFAIPAKGDTPHDFTVSRLSLEMVPYNHTTHVIEMRDVHETPLEGSTDAVVTNGPTECVSATVLTLVVVIVGADMLRLLGSFKELHASVLQYLGPCSVAEWYILADQHLLGAQNLKHVPAAGEIHLLDIAHIESLEPYARIVDQTRCGHRNCAYFLLKLFLDCVLPPDKKGALVLDTDLLVLADLLPLWKLLDRFQPNQLYGLAREMQPADRELVKFFRNYTIAFNGGVQLHHLDHIRQVRKGRCNHTGIVPLDWVLGHERAKMALRFARPLGMCA